MNPEKRNKLLLFTVAAETFLASYGLLLGDQAAIVSVLYLISGLAFTYCILMLPTATLPAWRTFKKPSILKVGGIVAMIFLAFITSGYWLEKIPLDPDFADMLPVIKVMNERFLQGHWRQVYSSIPEIWNGTVPIYLPAMWFPYLPAIAFQTDIRWTTVVALLLSFSVILLMIRFQKKDYGSYILLIVTAMLFWWIFARNDIHGLVSMSEEGVVIVYFILLTLAILSGNALLMGLAASCCMLSRYSMIGWLLPCMMYFIVKNEYRKAVVFSITGILFFLCFFLLPFGIGTLRQMMALPENYISFGRHVWEMTPEVYWQNLGMAKFFGRAGLSILHHTLLVLTFGVPLLFMGFCLWKKNTKFQNINLACFKLSVIVFYQFVDVPYGYLFYTSSFVSLVIAAGLYAPVRREVLVQHL